MTEILVFSATRGFRHDSIAAGVSAVLELAAAAGVRARATESAAEFRPDVLGCCAAVVWMQTSGTGLLDNEQRSAYGAFTLAGGGFAGIHAASDGERDWPLYTSLVGARFRSHPSGLREANVAFERPGDPCAQGLPDRWGRLEEWYAFDDNPRSRVDVIATVDESDYDTGDAGMGGDHPVVWRRQVGAARAWYTALGHTPEAYDSPDFRRHLWGGIASVMRPTVPVGRKARS